MHAKRMRPVLVGVIVILCSTLARAQYAPIPNYSGVGAGFQFRNAINGRLSGLNPISPKIVTLPFANLPTEQDGLILYCADCQKAFPCVGGGTGAWAFGQRGVWGCSPPPAEGTLDMGGHKLINLGTDAAIGDALSRGQSTMNSLWPPSASVPMNNQKLTGVGAPAATGDALSEGHAIGAVTPAAVTATNLTASGPISVTGGGTIAGLQTSNNGVFNVRSNLNLLCTGSTTPYSFCTGVQTGTFTAATGNGSTDDTTSIQTTINAAPAGATVLFPALPAGACYKFSSLTIPASLHLVGQGWSDDNWGAAFGSANYATHVKGSVLCSTLSTGRALDWQGATGGGYSAEGGDISDLFVLGPGANGTAVSITSCTESGTTVTCSATNSFAVDTPVYIAGNSVANYNGFVFLTAANSSSFSYVIRNDATSQGTGTGGTATPVAVGVSVGDSSYYATGVSSYHVGIGNFGTCLSVMAQNSRFYHTEIDGCYADGLYLQPTASYKPNNNLFSGITAAGRSHVNIDAHGQSNRFIGFDLENPATSDTTARSIYASDCNECLFDSGYVEDNAGGGYTGDDVQIDSGTNSIGATLINLHVTGGSGQNVHITGAAHTTILGGQFPQGVTIDSTSQLTNILFADGTITDNSASPNGSVIINENGTVAGTNIPTFSNGLTSNAAVNINSGNLTVNPGNIGGAGGFYDLTAGTGGGFRFYDGTANRNVLWMANLVGGPFHIGGNGAVAVDIDSATILTGGMVLSSTGGTAPTATCSGGSTGVSVTSGSTNNRGQITTSSSASTNCTITWSASSSWPQAPFCQFTDGSGSTTPTAFSTGTCGTGTCVFDFASATSKVVNWMCL